MSPTAELQLHDEEAQIPHLAAVAFGHAREDALKRGFRVLYIQDGQLREVDAAHQDRVLRSSKSTIHARKGLRIQLKDLRESHA
jgi:hypothetical protein